MFYREVPQLGRSISRVFSFKNGDSLTVNKIMVERGVISWNLTYDVFSPGILFDRGAVLSAGDRSFKRAFSKLRLKIAEARDPKVAEVGRKMRKPEMYSWGANGVSMRETIVQRQSPTTVLGGLQWKKLNK